MTPEMIKAIAELVSAVAWPLIVLLLVLSQKRAVSSLLSNLGSLTLPGGVEAKLRSRVEKETEAILKEDPKAAERLTERQLLAAEKIQRLSVDSDISTIRRQITELAKEYERTRASMSSGDERTRRMEIITTKMRTLSLAALPLLEELRSSDSPGSRLAAIAILQVTPNIEYVDWLAERLNVEKPFIGYHAAVALEVAARIIDRKHQERIGTAINQSKNNLGLELKNTDRWHVLDSAERSLAD